jgi:hypothetical protein
MCSSSGSLERCRCAPVLRVVRSAPVDTFSIER